MKIHIELRDDWSDNYKDKIEFMPAKIYFDNEGMQYPDNEWIDNPCILLGWWCHSVSEILSGREGQGLSFMEGPFALSVLMVDENLKITNLQNEVYWVVNKIDFARELLRATNKVSRFLQEKNFSGKAVQLDQAANILRKIIL